MRKPVVRRRAFVVVFAFLIGTASVIAAPSAGAVGEKNFNGPAAECPGAGWNCSTTVVGAMQVTDGGINLFVCRVAICSVSQTATNAGVNQLDCNQNTLAAGAQSCDFSQNSELGGNQATVFQRATMTGEVGIQSPSQNVEGSQTSTLGGSQITVDQKADLAQAALGIVIALPPVLLAISQNQQPYQAANLSQASEAGGQQTKVTQVQEMTQTTLLPLSSNQQQNTGVGHHQLVNMNQDNDVGSNRFEAEQRQKYAQLAVSVLSSIEQHQGVNGAGNGDSVVFYDTNSTTGQSDVSTNQKQEFHQDWVAVLLPITTVQTQEATQDVVDFGVAGSHPNRSFQTQEATLLSRLITGVQTCDQNISAINKDDGHASQFCSKQNLLGQITGPTVTTHEASGTMYTIHNA